MPPNIDASDWNRDGRVGSAEGFVGDRRGFTRDVLINVVANLVAGALTAATVYLVGVLLGKFAPYTWVVAASFVTWQIGLVWYVLFGRPRKAGWWAVIKWGLGVVLILATMVTSAVQNPENRQPLIDAVLISMCVTPLVAAAMFTRLVVKRRHSRAGSGTAASPLREHMTWIDG